MPCAREMRTKSLRTTTRTQLDRSTNALDGSFRSGPDRLRWAQRALAGASVHGPIDECPPVYDDIDRDLVADLVRALQRVVGAVPDGILGTETETKVKQAQRRAA
jgi:peptidoglycan hydrolase-like protein with peptidoglycan-binding domain